MNSYPAKYRNSASRTRRVKYVRYLGIAAFLGLALAALLYLYTSLTVSLSAMAGGALFLVMILVPSIRYFKLMDHPLFSGSTRAPTEPHKKPTMQKPIMREKRPTLHADLNPDLITDLNSDLTADLNSDLTTDLNTDLTPDLNTDLTADLNTDLTADLNTDLTADLNENINENINADLDEAINDRESLTQAIEREKARAMEKEITEATAHIDDALTDFDQSIAEAEFEAGLSSKDHINVFGKPSSKTKRSDKAMDFHFEIDEPETDPKIAELQREIVSLKNRQESLKVELAKLQIDVRNKNEVIEKREAEKNHAMELRDKAVQIANKERRQRKLTETKARQLIMKLKQNTLDLEDITDG